MDHLVFEVGTALVLVAIASVIANKIKFSIIPFLIILGMLVGPHAPQAGIIDLTFIESREVIEFFGRMGVLFLLFYLGLEFSVGKLVKSGRSIAAGGTIYILINFSLGLIYGFITGFSFLEVLVLAGVITISSSAIVAKVLVDLKRTANPETELILGIIMFEDIFLAVYLSVVSGLVLGDATFVGHAVNRDRFRYNVPPVFHCREKIGLFRKNCWISVQTRYLSLSFSPRSFSLPAFPKRFMSLKRSARSCSDSCFRRQPILTGLSTLSCRSVTFSGPCFSSASVSALIRFHSEMRYGLPSAPFC